MRRYFFCALTPTLLTIPLLVFTSLSSGCSGDTDADGGGSNPIVSGSGGGGVGGGGSGGTTIAGSGGVGGGGSGGTTIAGSGGVGGGGSGGTTIAGSGGVAGGGSGGTTIAGSGGVAGGGSGGTTIAGSGGVGGSGTECSPGQLTCVGNEVHACTNTGHLDNKIIETCDVGAGLTCLLGACKTACEVAESQPSNLGCEFWAVDLDQQDAANDPASAPWGLAISSVSGVDATVMIEINNGSPGSAQQLSPIPNGQFIVTSGAFNTISMPTRELDCGTKPNDYASPGTCLSSRAFRVTSSAPIVVYQFNALQNASSNDASLLIPTHSLGQQYRVLGWNAGHPVPVNIPGLNTIIDRAYVTIIGTKPGTSVTVHPSWKIKGNNPIPATDAGGTIKVTLGPFDVLNLETEDGKDSDDPKTVADLSGTFIFADKPIAVFSGVESASAPGAFYVPTFPGWSSDNTCCLDHLEEQISPLESLGSKYVIARSPVRSTSSFREPDVIRFVGGAEVSNITTNLPEAGFQSFTLQPGEVRTTYAQDNFTAIGDKPFLVGQILVSRDIAENSTIGDPSLTVFPPVDQYRTDYTLLTPSSWTQNWAVIVAEVGATVKLNNAAPLNCIVETAGIVDGKTYESRRCPLPTTSGSYTMSGDKPFGITAYGYGTVASYAVTGGANFKKIYTPPTPN